MKKQLQISFLLIISFVFIAETPFIEKKQSSNHSTEWVLAKLLHDKKNNLEIEGNPKIINSPFGEAVSFNGVNDALFLNELPLKDLTEFTVEMIFKPEPTASFEQRVLHIGEITKDRMLLEIRAVENNWYFDGYTCSGTNKKALIDETLTHPLGQWYHVAFVVTPKSLTTYVNGKKELHEENIFLPMVSGRTSFGVRQNKVSWFKGAIYKIRITPKSLKSTEFMTLKK
jgi:hypothetical protein